MLSFFLRSKNRPIPGGQGDKNIVSGEDETSSGALGSENKGQCDACVAAPTQSDGNKPSTDKTADGTSCAAGKCESARRLRTDKIQEHKKEGRSAVTCLMGIMAKRKGNKNSNKYANKSSSLSRSSKKTAKTKYEAEASVSDTCLQSSHSADSVNSASSSFSSAPCTPDISPSQEHAPNHLNDIPATADAKLVENETDKQQVKPEIESSGATNSADFVKIMVLQKYNRTQAPIYNNPVTSVSPGKEPEQADVDVTRCSNLRVDSAENFMEKPRNLLYNETVSEHTCDIIGEELKLQNGEGSLRASNKYLLNTTKGKDNCTTEDSLSLPDVVESIIPALETYDSLQDGDLLDKRDLVTHDSRFAAQLEATNEQTTSPADDQSNELRYQMQELQREIIVKSSAVERLQSELDTAHKDGDYLCQKLRVLVEDLNTLKHKEAEKTEEMTKTKDELVILQAKTVEDMNKLQTTVDTLELQLNELKVEKEAIDMRYKELQNEREEENKIVQEALDGALLERAELQDQWQLDFERLRTVNTGREQSLLEDFEWKLREVQKSCKQRMEEVESKSNATMQEALNKEKIAGQQLNEVLHLKSYEAEVAQLRGLMHEQQDSLKLLAKQLETLGSKERSLQCQLAKARAENEELKRKLIQKDEDFVVLLNDERRVVSLQWESTMKQEVARLRSDIEQVAADDRKQALELLKAQMLQEAKMNEIKWLEKLNALQMELAGLKKTLMEAQTRSDRQAMEMSRAVDKSHHLHLDTIDSLKVQHETEKDEIRQDCEKRLRDLDDSWSSQMDEMRNTLEAIRAELLQKSQWEQQTLSEKHRKQLEEQWEQLVQEKEEAMQAMALKHRTTIHALQVTRDMDLQAKVSELRTQYENETAADNRALSDQLAHVMDRERETYQQMNQLQKKYTCLTKLFEEMRTRCGQRDSQEDLQAITDLRRVISEQVVDLAALTEDKRYLQLELAGRSDSSCNLPRRKGGGRGKQSQIGLVGDMVHVMDTVHEDGEKQD